MQESVRLKSFDLFAKDIGAVDPSLLHALSISVGWSHRLTDWEFLLRAGRGIAAVDGIGRVFGTAMWFPHGEDFATIGLVITSPRTQAQGNGRFLMDHVLARCGDRDLSLNATRAAYGLYHALGFVEDGIVHLHQGEVSQAAASLPPLEGQIEDLARDAIAEIAPIDEAAFGVDRRRLLALLSDGASVRVLRRRQRIAGYSICRGFGRGHVIGPIVACHDDDAIHLAAAHMDAFRGRFMRVDTPSQGAFAAFLRHSGLSVCETVTTMSKGRRGPRDAPGQPLVYGLAGHALG